MNFEKNKSGATYGKIQRYYVKSMNASYSHIQVNALLS